MNPFYKVGFECRLCNTLNLAGVSSHRVGFFGLPLTHSFRKNMELYWSSWQRRVADVFNGPSIAKIDFYMEDLHISPRGLREVGDAIRNRRIKVELSKSSDAASKIGALYTPARDIMSFGSTAIIDVFDRAAIVHEGVHALIDMMMYRGLKALDDEAVAYIADAIYLAAEKTGYNYSKIDLQGRNLFGSAARLVKKKNMVRKKGVRLTRADLDELRRGVHEHESYRMLGDDELTVAGGVRDSVPDYEIDADDPESITRYQYNHSKGFRRDEAYYQLNGSWPGNPVIEDPWFY